MSKKLFIGILSILLIGFGVFFLFNGYSGEKEIAIIQKETELKVGNSYNVNRSIKGIYDDLEYSSSDDKIAVVNEDGVVIAKEEGNANITISNGKHSKKIRIHVTGKKSIEVSSVLFESCPETIYLNETKQLKYNISPSNATNKNVDIVSYDESIIKVLNNSKIKGINKGETMVEIHTTNSGKSDFCLIKVIEKDKADNKSKANSNNNSKEDKKKVISSSNNNNITTVINNPKTESDIIKETKVSNIILNEYNLNMYEGDTRVLNYTIVPNTATNKKVKFSTKNNKIIKVANTGEIRALKEGTAEVSVTTIDGGYIATCKINVLKREVKATNIKVDKESYTIEENNSVKLSPTVEPKNATNNILSYTSSNKDIVVVDSKGIVYGIKEGSATITITNGEIEKKIDFHVRKEETLKFNRDFLYLKVGEEEQLKVINQYNEETNVEMTYASSNPDIVKVSKTGKVTAVSKGNCIITATSGTKKASIYIEIKEKEEEKVEINNEKYTLTEGQTYKLVATTNFETAITWTSSDNSIATVTPDGIVEAKKEGTVKIKATAKNGLEKTCTITVLKLNIGVTNIKLDKESISALIGTNIKLNATIEPENATNKDITWTSSDNSIATVTPDGTVTAHKDGTVTITASSDNVSAKCNIYIVKPKEEQPPKEEKSLTIDHTKYTLYENDSFKLNATVTPKESNISFETSNKDIVTVTPDGTVTGIKEGTATIIVKSNELEKKCIVTVVKKQIPEPPQPEEKIRTTKSKFDLKIGNIDKVDILNQNNISVIKDTIIQNTNNNIATIDQEGNIKAISEGTTTITFTKNNQTVYAYITVSEIPIEKIQLNKRNEIIDIKKNKNIQLNATVEPENATNKELVWKSSNEEVATVSENGLVSFKKTGNVTIYAVSKKYSLVAPCDFTVISKVDKITISHNSPLEIGKKSGVYQTKNLSIEESYDGVNWDISDKSIAVIVGNRVIPQKPGEAIITAKKDDASDSIKLIVEELTLPDITEVKVGKTVNLNATLQPATAKSKTITYSSKDPTIATVDEKTGKVTGVSVGSTIIAASNGITSVATKVTVTSIAVTGISLNKSNMRINSINENKSVQLDATIKPSTAVNKNVIWTSDNQKVATVTNYGKVEFKAPGKVTITATTADGNKQAHCSFELLQDYKVAVIPEIVDGRNVNQDYKLTHIDSQELKDSSGSRHRLQQFDLIYDNRFNVDNIFYMFPENTAGAGKYKTYYTQKADDLVRTISYSDGGHGAAFDILKIKDGVVSVLTDSYGVVANDGGGDALKIGLINLNYKGQKWNTYNSYSNSNSSRSFAYNFGCKSKNNYYYDDDCVVNNVNYSKLKTGYKSMLPLTAYDSENNLVAFWSENKKDKTISIYRYSDLQKTTNFEGLSTKDNTIKPIYTISVDDFSSPRQGMAIHRGVVYGLWGNPDSPSEINIEIRGYDIVTGDLVYTKTINKNKVEDLKENFTTLEELEPEGIKIKTNPNTGAAYVHIGIYRGGKESAKEYMYSSIYRINGN